MHDLFKGDTSLDNLFLTDLDFAKIAACYLAFKEAVAVCDRRTDSPDYLDEIFDMTTENIIYSMGEIGDVGLLFLKKISEQLTVDFPSQLSGIREVKSIDREGEGNG